MTPPERLRHELERQRALGRTFRTAWPIARAYALEGLSRSSTIWWRSTFSEQRRYWAANYSGPNVGLCLEQADREPRIEQRVAIFR